MKACVILDNCFEEQKERIAHMLTFYAWILFGGCILLLTIKSVHII